jgi:hypothetical protein
LTGKLTGDFPVTHGETGKLTAIRHVRQDSPQSCNKLSRKEHVLKSMPAKDDLTASSELVDMLEDLIPGIFGHEADKQVQTHDGLLIEMVENGCRQGVGIMALTSFSMNVLS